MKTPTIALCGLLLSAVAVAQPCPKVATTTQTPATMRAIVKSINCLVESGATPTTTPATLRSADFRGGTQVDTLAIIGPQHSPCIPGLSAISMPVDNAHKSALVLRMLASYVRGAGGGECKSNSMATTLDAQCNQAGGTVFVVFK
jgi:hypothetical protein